MLRAAARHHRRPAAPKSPDGDAFDDDADRRDPALPVAPRPRRDRHASGRARSPRSTSRSRKRLRQLAASLDRLHGMDFTFGQRYVVVNIPAAVAEAVENGKVARRYVVGRRQERPAVADAHHEHHRGQPQSDLDGAAVAS